MTENFSYLSGISDSYRNEMELGLSWADKLFALLLQTDLFEPSQRKTDPPSIHPLFQITPVLNIE